MKKLISILLTLVMVFSSMAVFADAVPEVLVNDEKVEFDVGPMYVDGVLMLPVRFICEKFPSKSVVWNEDTETVVIVDVNEMGEQSLVMIQLGNDKIFSLDSAVQMEKAPFETGGRTLVSADFFEKADLNWTVMLKDGIVDIKSAF